MDTSNALFLQHLYQQDTLYVVPEENRLANQPVPPSVAVVEPEPVLKSHDLKKEAEEVAPAAQKGKAPEPDITWMGEATKGTYLLFEVLLKTLPNCPTTRF